MSEMRLPERNDQPPPPKPRRREESYALPLGIAIGAVIAMFGGALIAFGITGNRGGSVWAMASPAILGVLLGVAALLMGRPRLAVGIFLGMALIVAAVLLLVAACFGLVVSASR